jgi:energy-coupling factor transporter ATP-binding protein EcfA2
MTVDMMGRDFEIKYLKKNIKKGIILMLGPRGIGKTTVLKIMLKLGIINQLFNIQEYLLRADYHSYTDLYELISEHVDGPCGIDNFDHIPGEYKRSDLLISLLEKLEENGAIISSYKHSVIDIISRLGFRPEVFYIKELGLEYTYNNFLERYPDEEHEYLIHAAILSEGYPDAMNYYLSLGAPSKYLEVSSGFLSINLDIVKNYDYLFNKYQEFQFIKRDVTTFNLLSSIAKGLGRPRDLYRMAGHVTPVYLSRLYDSGVLDKVVYGKYSFYYIRDPILRLHFHISGFRERYMPIQYIHRYVGLAYLVLLLFIQSQGHKLIDLNNREVAVPQLTGKFRILDNNIVYLEGTRYNLGIACTFKYNENIVEELISFKVDTKILVCYVKPDQNILKRLSRKGIHVIDKWGLDMLTAKTGFRRRI